jgi:hypothetical protein
MNLRGKVVTVKYYKLGTNKLVKKVTGKVKSIHTARNIRDSSYIDLVDRFGKPIRFYNVYKHYWAEPEIVSRKELLKFYGLTK